MFTIRNLEKGEISNKKKNGIKSFLQTSLGSFVALIVGLFIITYVLIGALFGLDTNIPGIINPIFSAWERFFIVFGFIVSVTGIGLRMHKSKAFTTEINLYLIIFSLILGGIFFLLLIKLQPKSLFTAPPTEEWWVALSILAVLFIGFFALEFVKIRDVLFLKKDLLERMENMEEYRTIHESIYDDYSNEGLSAQERWNKSYQNIQKIKNPKLISSKFFRAWSRNAWNDRVVDIAIALRRDAYNLDKEDDWNKLFYANILVDESSKEEIEAKSIRKILSNIPSSRMDEFAFSQFIYGKFNLKSQLYSKAIELFKNAIEYDDTFYYRFYYLLSLYLEQNVKNFSGRCFDKLRSILNEWDKEYNKNWSDIHDDMSFESAKMMFRYLSGEPDKKNEYKRKFYRCFSPLKSLEFNSIQFIDRYSMPPVFSLLKEVPEEEQLVYLTFYKFFGALDNDADKIIKTQNGDMMDKIETNILSSWQFGDS